MLGLTTPQPLNFDLLTPFTAIPGARLVTAFRDSTETTIDPETGAAAGVQIVSAPVLYTAAGGGPYFDLDGTADYLYVEKADHTEPLLQATMIIVYNPDAAAVARICGAWAGGGNDKYQITLDASNNVAASVTADGSTAKTATQSSGYTAGAWNMAALVFKPSSYVRIWANGNATSNVTAIGAGLFNATSDLFIGASNSTPTTPLNGKVGLFALYGTVIHDDHLAALYAHVAQFYR